MPRTKTEKAPKLNQLDKIHGKVEKSAPTTIEQLMGLSGNKYGTLNIAEYTQKLDNFTWEELRSHALDNGLIPGDVENKQRIKNTLIQIFNEYRGKFMTSEAKIVEPRKSKVNFVEQALKKVLNS